MNYTVQNSLKTVNMMDLRRNIGSIIDEIIYTGKEIVINKHGKPVCLITALPNNEQNDVAGMVTRKQNIKKLFGAIKMTSQETKQWLNQGYEADQEYDQKICEAWEVKSV